MSVEATEFVRGLVAGSALVGAIWTLTVTRREDRERRRADRRVLERRPCARPISHVVVGDAQHVAWAEHDRPVADYDAVDRGEPYDWSEDGL